MSRYVRKNYYVVLYAMILQANKSNNGNLHGWTGIFLSSAKAKHLENKCKNNQTNFKNCNS